MKTLLSILLTIFICQISQAGIVSGTALYQGDSLRPINNAIVILKDGSNNFFATYVTGPDGYYEFLNVPTGTYNIKGTKDAPGVGVTMLDATLVLLHIFGFYPFNDIQKLAADVNGDRKINMADYKLIVKHILRNTPFPIGDWVFLDETIIVTDLKGSNPGGLTGSSSGDVGGVFVPGTKGLEAYPTANAGTVKVSGNEPFTVSVTTTEDLSMSGTGLIINFPSEIVSVQSVDFPMAGYEYVIDGNQVRVVWSDPKGSLFNLKSGSDLVTLHCTTKDNFTAGMSANFTLDGSSSFISNSYTEIKDAKLQVPTIEYTMPSLRLSNYPNPFNASTTLAYYLPKSGLVTISLFDQNGRIVKEIKLGELAEGYQSYILEGSGLPSGSYFCKLNLSGNKTETIRILKMN